MISKTKGVQGPPTKLVWEQDTILFHIFMPAIHIAIQPCIVSFFSEVRGMAKGMAKESRAFGVT